MSNPIEKFKRSILHLNRSLHRCITNLPWYLSRSAFAYYFLPRNKRVSVLNGTIGRVLLLDLPFNFSTWFWPRVRPRDLEVSLQWIQYSLHKRWARPWLNLDMKRKTKQNEQTCSQLSPVHAVGTQGQSHDQSAIVTKVTYSYLWLRIVTYSCH